MADPDADRRLALQVSNNVRTGYNQQVGPYSGFLRQTGQLLAPAVAGGVTGFVPQAWNYWNTANQIADLPNKPIGRFVGKKGKELYQYFQEHHEGPPRKKGRDPTYERIPFNPSKKLRFQWQWLKPIKRRRSRGNRRINKRSKECESYPLKLII
jgi:hypothetical protein